MTIIYKDGDHGYVKFVDGSANLYSSGLITMQLEETRLPYIIGPTAYYAITLEANEQFNILN